MLRSISVAVLAAALLAGCGTSRKDDPPPGDCTGRIPGDLVISEFMANPAGEDQGKEYVEIFNASSQVIQLTGIALRYTRPDGTAEKKAVLTRGSIAPGDYYVIGDAPDPNLLPGHLNDSYQDQLGALGNTSGNLSVLCGTTVLDEVKYTVVKEGASRIFDGSIFPDSAANDDETRWCNATEQSGDFLGSPRYKNASCQAATCAGKNPGDFVITEFMPNPAGTDDGNEYIEIYNATSGTIDLSGMTLHYTRLDGTAPKAVVLGQALVGAGKYFTLGDVRTPTLPAHIDYSYGTALGALGNTDGTLSIKCGITIVDEVSYTRMKEGSARVFDGNLTPNATSNDDEGSWCDAKAPFGTFFGSPRAVNEACGSVATGCIDPVTQQSRSPNPPPVGKLVLTEVMANPAGTDSDQEWFELYAHQNVDLNGVVVSRGTINGTTRVTFTSEQCLAIPAGSYAVIARKLGPDVNGGIASPLTTFNFSLTDPTAPATTVAMFVSYNGALIDQANYPKMPTGTGSSSVSVGVTGDRLEDWVNDGEYAWCGGQTPYGTNSSNWGTPGAANPVCNPLAVAPGECRDPDGGVRAINRPDGGALAITEVMAAPTPPDGGVVTDRPKEWFELTAIREFDLNEVEVSNEVGQKSSVKQAACFTVVPGEYVLFAQSASSSLNGGLPPPRVVFDFDVNNSASTANPERSVIVRSLGSELDKYAWTSSTVGASNQLSSTVTPSPTENDVSTNRCDAPVGTTYGTGDRGTPGSANAACP